MAVSLLVIEDKTIAMMLGDHRFLAAFPCLDSAGKAVQDIPRKCGRCNRKRSKARGDILSQVRNCLATLSPGKKNELKTLLGAKKIRLTRRESGGRSVRLTF